MLRKIGNSKTIGDIEKQKIISVNITSYLPLALTNTFLGLIFVFA